MQKIESANSKVSIQQSIDAITLLLRDLNHTMQQLLVPGIREEDHEKIRELKIIHDQLLGKKNLLMGRYLSG